MVNADNIMEILNYFGLNKWKKISVLLSLEDWLKLIERELVQCYSASTTLLALRKLGKI